MNIKITPLEPQAEFDIWLYSEISQEPRVEHTLLVELEPTMECLDSAS